MLATERPRKTAVPFTAMGYASAEITADPQMRDAMRAGLDRALHQRLAAFNKRGPRWRLGPVRYGQVPDLERGLIRYYARATFERVPDAGA